MTIRVFFKTNHGNPSISLLSSTPSTNYGQKAECSSVRNRYYLPIVELLEEKKYQGIVSSIRKRLTTIGQQLVALCQYHRC